MLRVVKELFQAVEMDMRAVAAVERQRVDLPLVMAVLLQRLLSCMVLLVVERLVAGERAAEEVFRRLEY